MRGGATAGVTAPAAAAAVALLGAAEWLGDPGVGYLATVVLATAASAVLARWRGVRSPLSLRVCVVLLVALSGVASRAQWRLLRFADNPQAVGRRQAQLQQTRLRAAVTRELSTLRAIAAHARQVPRDPVLAVDRLEHLLGDTEHRAAAILRGDTLMAWAGTLHAHPAALTAPVGLAATPFGLTLYVVSDSGAVRTLAASLLYAAIPADRVTRGLAQRLDGDELTEGFTFAPPSDSARAGDLRFVDGSGGALFIARSEVPSTGEVRFRLLERARVRVGVLLLGALVAFVVVCTGQARGALAALIGALVVLRVIAVAPLSAFSTRSRLFDAAVYFFPPGRALSANAAALTLTAATVLLTVLLLRRRVGNALPRLAGGALALSAVAVGPYAVGALAKGITPPPSGAEGALWLIWTVPLCFVASAFLVAASWGGRGVLGARRGVPPALGPTLALLAAVAAPLVWRAPGQWPSWYAGSWILAATSVVLARPTRRALATAAAVAALGAVTVVWGAASRGRVELAERDVRGLTAPDSYGDALAQRLANALQGEELPLGAQALLDRYVRSDLGSSSYPVALVSWSGTTPVASFGSAPLDVAYDTVGMLADSAARSRRRLVALTRAGAYGVRVVAVPMRTGAVTILLAPRTRLIGTDAYTRWYGLAAGQSTEPPYTIQVVAESLPPRTAIRWRRDGTELHGDWPVLGPSGPARAHVEVDLRGVESLVPRGGLLALADLIAVAAVWLLAALGDGRAVRWMRLRRRRVRSFRVQLSFALFLFFLVPAATFAVWSWRQLSDDALASRRLLVTETMRAFSGDPLQPGWLTRESRRLDTKLLLYRSGVLVAASDSLFADLVPMGRLLRPAVALTLSVADEVSATMPEPLAGATGMLGYRVLPATHGSLVLAAPARVDDLLLDRRRRDLGILVLFASALGAAAALWLSARAGRQLARPIGALRSAAGAVARGAPVPLGAATTREFQPVFSAFDAMTRDLQASRAALEEAKGRTDAVLRTVASGVMAVDERGTVILSNPRAEQLLGSALSADARLVTPLAPSVAVRVLAFLAAENSEDGFEIERDGRTLRGRLTRLRRGGAVLTIDDVTELARAQRVLAWGEMARQVAHEIKNPLTPIRLGVQHLRRAFGRPEFPEVLEENVTRILGEIDRLDEIARAFSRYGTAPEERPPAEPTDVGAIVEDVVALERLGEGAVRWLGDVAPALPPALARAEELREVLLNLFENARLAEAREVRARVEAADSHVTVTVTDDGSGIHPAVLPRIFEPHFSTRTSGSGLGLAITRRLVESWGGDVTIESEVGQGTTVRVSLRAAPHAETERAVARASTPRSGA